MEKPDEKRIERTLEIAAPVQAVWKAISEARELERWFPFQARFTGRWQLVLDQISQRA